MFERGKSYFMNGVEYECQTRTQKIVSFLDQYGQVYNSRVYILFGRSEEEFADVGTGFLLSSQTEVR